MKRNHIVADHKTTKDEQLSLAIEAISRAHEILQNDPTSSDLSEVARNFSDLSFLIREANKEHLIFTYALRSEEEQNRLKSMALEMAKDEGIAIDAEHKGLWDRVRSALHLF
jgi:hypothetical protein